jgi:hypothetical protein
MTARRRQPPALLRVALLLAATVVLLSVMRPQADPNGRTVPSGATLFGSAAPATPASSDPRPVDLGVVFTPARDGLITGARFYKGAGNEGPHVGRVWAPDGALLGSSTFADETASGWQSLVFQPAIPVRAGEPYVVGYHAPRGRYAADAGYFSRGPRSTPFGVATGSVYRYGSGESKPTLSHGGTNYWVDVTFRTGDSSAASGVAIKDLPRIPWEGGPAYWGRFSKARAAGWTEETFFPIAVWYAPAAESSALRRLGINVIIPNHDGFDLLGVDPGVSMIVGQEFTPAEVGDNPRVVGWEGRDECDMGYTGCAAPAGMTGPEAAAFGVRTLQQTVDGVRRRRDGRFVYNNFSKGILGTHWGQSAMDDFLRMVDVASADIYYYTFPEWDIAGTVPGSPSWPGGAEPRSSASYGWSIDQLRRFQWRPGVTPNWAFVEVGHPASEPEGQAQTMRPEWMEGAIWSALVHEARGIILFNHSFGGACRSQNVLKECQPAMAQRLSEVSRTIRSLAPVLNTQSYVHDFRAGVDTMLKVRDDVAYIFATPGLTSSPGEATFILPPGVAASQVTVVGEDRTIPIVDGAFRDRFDAEYSHHIYAVALS